MSKTVHLINEVGDRIEVERKDFSKSDSNRTRKEDKSHYKRNHRTISETKLIFN